MKRFTVILLLVALFAINSIAQKAGSRTTPVVVGAEAPDFTLTGHDGKVVKLSEARGKSPVVLVFYRGYW